MGSRVDSYSDSEAADRCKTSGLGTLPASRTEVAERTGERDIIFLARDAHESVTGPVGIASLCCDLLAYVCTKSVL